MGKSNELFYYFVSVLFLNHLIVGEGSVNDDINSLSANLKDSLIILGKNASYPQPRFGLDSPIEPLVAVAPLRYLHEGDLLKLRLQLNNVTLEGLSTLAVQEVTFNLPADHALRKALANEGASIPAGDRGNENKDENVSEYDYYDEVEDDEYEVMSHHDYSDDSKRKSLIPHDDSTSKEDRNDGRHSVADVAKKENDEIPYLDDFSSHQRLDENDLSEDDYDLFAQDDSYDKPADDHVKEEYNYDYSNSKRYKRNSIINSEIYHHSHTPKNRHSKRSKSKHNHISHKNTKPILNLTSATQESRKHFVDLNEKSKRHFDELEEQSRRHIDKMEEQPRRHLDEMEEQPRRHLDEMEEQPRRHLDEIEEQPRRHLDEMPEEHHSTEISLRHHRYKIDPKSLRKNKRTVNTPIPEDIPPTGTNLKKILSIPARVRVSFSDMNIKAQYTIRGRAGGVFTFKEQGKLVLTIPNVFLTSEFNVTLIPEVKGLRHWKNNRRNHLRVQKVRSRLSLEVPKLTLIPASRPSEWVRRQLQEKMEELGKGVGKRDGAIRLLLRHWARLLRRLVTKASKQSWNDLKKVTN